MCAVQNPQHFHIKKPRSGSKARVITPFIEDWRRRAASGPWLRRLRHALGLTLEGAARRIGCSVSEVSRLERYEQDGKLHLATLARVLRAYECRLAYAPVPMHPDESLEELRLRLCTRVPNIKPRWWEGPWPGDIKEGSGEE